MCGRYEGFDERIRAVADLELSIGDYVLTGGELPAMVVIDAVARLLPGVLGGESSSEEESLHDGAARVPSLHPTRDLPRAATCPRCCSPATTRAIAAWRREQAIRRTARRRPDLLAAHWDELTDDERAIAERARTETSEEA